MLKWDAVSDDKIRKHIQCLIWNYVKRPKTVNSKLLIFLSDAKIPKIWPIPRNTLENIMLKTYIIWWKVYWK